MCGIGGERTQQGCNRSPPARDDHDADGHQAGKRQQTGDRHDHR